jgi:hypothetical protein
LSKYWLCLFCSRVSSDVKRVHKLGSEYLTVFGKSLALLFQSFFVVNEGDRLLGGFLGLGALSDLL